MTEENKQLLLEDLCARLLYGVKVAYAEEICDLDTTCRDGSILLKGKDGFIPDITDSLFIGIDEIKPYLRPMESMTIAEYNELMDIPNIDIYDDGRTITNGSELSWLNKKMFDYRGLIPMNLALEALEGMYE